MSKYTNLIMHLLCHTVVKVPYLFPSRLPMMKRLHWVAKDYFQHIENYSAGYEEIKTFSLFEPSLKWKAKAISVLTVLSSDEAKSILKWKNKQETFQEVRTDVSIFSQSERKIGKFKVGFGKSGFHFNASLGVDSKYVKSCSVYLVVLDNGHYYLSVYWILKEEATSALRYVDVSNIKKHSVDYYTCNPFSKKFGHCQFFRKSNSCHQIILDNIESISNDIKVVEKRLFQLLGVNSRGNQAVTLDIHVDEIEPYYTEHMPEKKVEAQDTGLQLKADGHLEERFKPFSTIIENYESREFLVRLPELSGSSIDLVFIKSQIDEEVDEFRINDFAFRYYSPLESHLVYLFLELIDKNYQLLDKKFSESLLSTYKAPKKSHQHSYQKAYKAFIETSIIEGQLRSILDSKFMFSGRCEASILKDFMTKTERNLNTIKKVKLDIEAKKTAANELVQAANLTYQQGIAKLVAGLAALQVIIAVATAYNFDFVEKITTLLESSGDYFK